MKTPSDPSRREFLRAGLGAIAGLAAGARFSRAEAPGPAAVTVSEAPRTARVVLVRDAEAVTPEGKCHGPVVRRMLDEAVAACLRKADPEEAWSEILRPEDWLGIKTNVCRPLVTPPELEQAIRARALEAGIPEERIAIDDRGVLENPVFQRATALVNVRPLRTHHWAGIGGCIKNYIMFSPSPPSWHADSCADLGGLWRLPACAGKTRLNILAVLTPLFYGIGPHHYDPEFVWPYGGLLVGTDPVAVDAVGVELLARKRASFFPRPPRGGTSTHHVQLAETRHGLGVADLERIELIKLGWGEGSLL